MNRRIFTVLGVLSMAAPAAGLEIEFTDVTGGVTLTVVDGSGQDQYPAAGEVGVLNADLSGLAVRFVRCSETIVPGVSAALVIDQSVPTGGLTNISGPSGGELGAREFGVECRGTTMPGIVDWRAALQYAGDAQDDSLDEVALPANFATLTVNGGTDLLATVAGPPIFPAVPFGGGQPVAWRVRSLEPTDSGPSATSMAVRLEIAPRGRDRVEIDRLRAAIARTGLSCTTRKNKCVGHAVQGLLTCHHKAERKGVAVDPLCLARFEDRFDGGAVPADGCIERYETSHPPTHFSPCATYDDQAALDATLTTVVGDVLAMLGTQAQNKCSAKKKACVGKLQKQLLSCHKKADVSGHPVDIACVRAALDKFADGATPGTGCFARLEAKFPPGSATPCLTYGDAGAVADRVLDFVRCVTGALGDPSGMPCIADLEQGCGLPRCKNTQGQQPDCTYAPVVGTPRYGACRGPLVLVDRTHNNFHNLTPESPTYKGRYWGFARLLMADGYDVRDSTEPFASLLASAGPDILVIANPRVTQGMSEALLPADVSAVVNWVAQGGALLLIIDHPPYNRIGSLMQAFGLQRFAANSDDPPCSLPVGPATCWTFTRASGSLNPGSVIANGFAAGEDIDDVSTFFGTYFTLIAMPPATASYEGVLTFPAGSMAHGVNIGGFWQGVAIQFGSGRVYVAGEAGSLTAQNTFGMHHTPDNEQYLLNIVHGLD